MKDYLAAEPLIIERVRARCATELGLRQVIGVADLEGVESARQVLPAAYVLYGGERVPEERTHRGAVQQVNQRWYVVLAQSNRRDASHGSDWRREIGGMLAALNAALQGWKPSAEHGELTKAAAPAPLYRSGYGYWPLAFNTRIVTRGESR